MVQGLKIFFNVIQISDIPKKPRLAKVSFDMVCLAKWHGQRYKSVPLFLSLKQAT
jgi:hypothetical protein